MKYFIRTNCKLGNSELFTIFGNSDNIKGFYEQDTIEDDYGMFLELASLTYEGIKEYFINSFKKSLSYLENKCDVSDSDIIDTIQKLHENIKNVFSKIKVNYKSESNAYLEKYIAEITLTTNISEKEIKNDSLNIKETLKWKEANLNKLITPLGSIVKLYVDTNDCDWQD